MQRRFKTKKALADAWEAYKSQCDNQAVQVTEFSAKEARFVTDYVPKKTTYTIEGFCVFVGLSRQAFYADYVNDGEKRYLDIVTRMREECEVDARSKFETGQIPTQLAGLWMGRYGYSTKQEVKDDTAKAKAIENIESLVNQMNDVSDDDVAE